MIQVDLLFPLLVDEHPSLFEKNRNAIKVKLPFPGDSIRDLLIHQLEVTEDGGLIYHHFERLLAS